MLFSRKTRLTQILLSGIVASAMLGSTGSSYAQDVSGDEINALIIDLAESGQGGDLEALFDALSSYRATQDWPDSDAIVTGQGDCTFVASSCNPDNHDADVTLPAVSNVHIIYPENTSTDVGTEFKVVWDPPVLSSGSQYALSRYEVALIIGGKEYENFVVAPELQDDGSYQLKNSIRIRDRKLGRHYVHVRAIYETQSEGFSSGLSASLGQHLIAPSRGLSGEGFSGGFASTWGGGGFGDVVTPTKVQDLASVNAALHACVSAVYSATTSLNTINSLTCRNQNIADLEGIQHLSALRTLALSNGRTISGGNLPNHNTFTNLSKLFSLADLVTLDISNTSVSVSQIESLMDNVTSIESLRIAYIPLASFPDLRPQPGFGSTIITNLKILDISYTGLSSINTGTHKISDLNNLHALSASGNPLDKNFSLSSNSNLFEAILKDIDVHGSLSMANFPDKLDYLYLSDQPNTLGSNPFSELLTLIQNPSNSVAHAGIDHVLDLSGNTGMYCSNVKAVETWFWARTDACAANPFTGECTRPHLAVYSPSYCYPDKINNFSVYRNVSGAFVFNWDAVPNNWGVVRYEIDTYDSNNQQTRLEVTDTQSEQLVASYLAQDSVQFEMRACVAQQCGESTGLMTLSPDLTRAKNITSVWNGSSFQLKWQYPADVFNHSGGRGKPDYFLVLPVAPKAGAQTQYQINVTQGSINTGTIWQSGFLNPANNLSNLYRIRACRLENGVEYCGPSASVDVVPIGSAAVNHPSNVNAIKQSGTNRVELSWDQVNDPTVDYYLVEERFTSALDNPNGQVATRLFYTEKDHVSINRESNGAYSYSVKSCRRVRNDADGDKCSPNAGSSGSVTISTNPNTILSANTNPGFSGWMPHGSDRIRLALRLQNGSEHGTRPPDYFKVQVALETNEAWGNFSYFVTNDISVNGRYISPENLSLPRPGSDEAPTPYQVNIQGCINGHICSAISTLTVDSNNQITDENLGGNAGGPASLNPGLWWNPDYAGTGWYFYWSSGLRYPQVHENYGNTYDLIAVWGSYQLIDGVWSPIWMYAELKLDASGTFYSGAMYYPQKPICTGSGETRDCQENIIHAADIEVRFQDAQGNGSGNNNAAFVLIKHMNLPGMPEVDLDQGTLLEITNFESTGLCTVAGPTCEAFGTDNPYDYLSGLWSPDTDGDGVFIDEEFIVMNWIEKSLEGMMVGFYDDSPTGRPIYALAQSCRNRPNSDDPDNDILEEDDCDRPSTDYLEYTSFVSNNPNSPELPNNHNFFYSVESGYAPTEQKPVGFDITQRNFMLPPASGEITGGGRHFSTVSFNRGNAWFNFKYDKNGRHASLLYGSQLNEEPLVRGANFHDIRHFANGIENGNCTDTSPSGQCELKLTWFTDDFYTDTKVYFQKDQETPQTLDVLCGAAAPGGFVVEQYFCSLSNLQDIEGTYRFFLINDRNSGDGWDPDEVIARSFPFKVGDITVENMPSVADIDPPSITGLVHPNPNHDATVGAVAGSPGTSGGAASYNIPITLPPGRQGMAPSVGIGYNSRGGNGVMGMGWSLSAGSSIHRCPMTVAQDGSTIGVQYTENDRLCLDGQRLIRVNSGDYWATAGEYYTELNSFVKVEMLGGSADSAANARGVGLSFEVYGKDNILREYGVSALGRVQPTAVNGNLPAVVSSWLLEIESDPAGNRIDYDYTNFGYGESLLSQILYTGFNNTPGNRAVQLSYGDRSAALEGSSPAVFKDDYASSWQAGYETRQTKKLEKITTCSDVSECSSNGKVREYQLSYVSSNSTQRLLFNAITECAFVNGAPTCLEPTLFSWISKQPKFVYEKLTSNAVDYIPNTDFNYSVWGDSSGDLAAPDIDILGDYNGDGVREMRMSMQGKSYLVSVDAAGVIQGKIRLSDATIQALTNYRYRGDQDFNDDGRSDFLVAVKDTANTLESDPYVYAIAQWKPGFTFNCTGECTISQAFDIRRTNITADVIEVPVGPGAGDEDDDGDNSVIIQLPTNTPHVADFNGDGQKDLMLLGTQNQLELYINIEDEAAAQVNNASNINFTSALIIDMPDFVEDPSDPQSDLLVYRQPQLADFDGDGAVDIMLQVDPVGDLDPIDNINAGFGAVIFNNLQSSGYQVTGATTTANIAAYFSDVRIVSTMVANLQGGVGNYAQITLAVNPLLQYYQMLDINGDGLQDLLYVDDLTSANCEQLPGTSSLSHEWHYQLNTGDRDFLFTSGVATGNCRGLERVSGTIGYPTPAYSRLMKLFDYNNDGRSEIMVPESLHQSICYLPASTSSSTPEPRSYCPAEPNGTTPGWIGTCTVPEASLCEMYEYGKGSQDQSTYAMGLLSFKANSSGAYTIDTIPAVDTGLVTSAHMKADDLFGDGVSNVYGRVGCIESPVGATNSGMSSDRCEISLGFPTGGAAEAGLKAGLRGYYQNRMVLNSPAGALPAHSALDLLSSVSDAFDNQVYWSYLPLSAERDVPSVDLPLYRIPDRDSGDSLYDYDPAHHFYFQSSMYVVSSMQISNGLVIGGNDQFNTTYYGYEEAVFNNQGRGFQGFRKVLSVDQTADSDNDLLTVSSFHQVFPLAGRLYETMVHKASVAMDDVGKASHALSVSTTNWACWAATNGLNNEGTLQNLCAINNDNQAAVHQGGVYQVVNSGSQARSQEPNDAYKTYACTETFNVAYDGYGNRLRESMRSREFITPINNGPTACFADADLEQSKTTVYDYTNNESSWWLGRLDHQKTTTSLQYSDALVDTLTASQLSELTASKTVSQVISWNNSLRKPTCMITVADDFEESCHSKTNEAQFVQTTTQYDTSAGAGQSYGNPVSVSVVANDGASETPARTTTSTYSADGYFVNTVVNPLGHSIETVVDPREGNPLRVKDANEQVARMDYDAFGRNIRSWYPRSQVANAQIGDDADFAARTNHYAPRTHINYRPMNSTACGLGNINRPEAAYCVVQRSDGSPEQVQVFDRLNRAIFSGSKGFANNGGSRSWSVVESLYNARGQMIAESVPRYLNSANSYWTDYSYDVLNRTTEKHQDRHNGDDNGVDGLDTFYRHQGLLTRIFVGDYGATQPAANAVCSTPNYQVDLNNPATLALCMERTYSAGGQLLSTKDANGEEAFFLHDSQGNPAYIRDVEDNVIYARYNAFAQREFMSDPNQGDWSFTYNGLGELTKQVDARDTEIQFQYDLLGRMTERRACSVNPGFGSTCYEGATPAESQFDLIVDSWHYDNGAITNGSSPSGGLPQTKGLLSYESRLVKTSGGLGSEVFREIFKRHYEYDSDLRPGGHITTVNPLTDQNTAKNYQVRIQNDSYFARPFTVTWPGNNLRLYNRYDQQGYLTHEGHSSHYGQSNELDLALRRVISMTPTGQVELERYGNNSEQQFQYNPSTWQLNASTAASLQPNQYYFDLNYRYDLFGNITKQTKAWPVSNGANNRWVQERFDYDHLHRLRISERTWGTGAVGTMGSGQLATIDFEYSPNGNLTSKSDYANSYVYAANQVQQVTLDNGDHRHYQYDANGNMVRAYDTGGIGGNADRKLLKFDAFNKPTRIQNSGLDQNLEDNGHVLEFSYGSNGQRFYQLKGDAPGQGSGYVGDEYKIYIDKMMEITGDINDTQDSGAKLYIGDYAVYDISTDLALARSQAKLQYLYRDRLGSVVAIADSNGDLVETAGRGFDPFGKPREDDWSDSDHRNNGLNDQGDTADIPGDLNRDDLTTRGFTGHEHLNETDLIHMNGRVYDYNLGRFYSVDPFIQFPENSQSVNGYSYILNNPLSGTDPSGYQSNSDVDTQTAAGSSSGGNSAMDQAKEAAADSIVEVRITHKRGTTGCRTCKGEVTGITAKYGSGLSVSVSGRKGGFQINGVSLTPNIHQSGKKGESSEIGSVEDRKLVSKDVEFGKSEIDPKTMLARSSSGTSTVAGTTSKTLKKNNLSIRGSAEFKSKVAQVEAKAKQAGLTIFDDLRNGPVEVIIMEVTGDSVFAMYKNRKTKADVPVVEWNPALAMKVRYASVGRDQYAYQSAALGLVHELGHAHQYSIQSLRGDLPESPVINGWEKQWAEFFGEKTRHPSYLHGGENRKTNDIFWFSK